MIKVTTLDNHDIYINSFYIESITKHSPVDTIIRLRSGKTHAVTETPTEIVQLIEGHRRSNSLYSDADNVPCQETI